MAYEILTSLKSLLAEGPLYRSEDGRVYWTDIDSGLLHRFDVASGAVETVHEGTKIGGFTIQEDGSLLLFRAAGAIHLLKDGVVTALVEEIPDEVTTRFNDVAADPAGRVFCGTMPTDKRRGRLYRLDPDGSLRIVLEGVGCSNGIGWTRDRKTMYFTDTSDRVIDAFDYDESSGEISNRRNFYTHRADGFPDGMTVDAEDHLWVALWDGGCVLRLSLSGEIVERYELPARKITCPTFGGPELRDLYVTTAGGNLNEGDGAGELIRMRTGAVGKPEFRSRIQMGVKA